MVSSIIPHSGGVRQKGEPGSQTTVSMNITLYGLKWPGVPH